MKVVIFFILFYYRYHANQQSKLYTILQTSYHHYSLEIYGGIDQATNMGGHRFSISNSICSSFFQQRCSAPTIAPSRFKQGGCCGLRHVSALSQNLNVA
mmetsp:Transcript_38443/g.69290  ORF Transcript_38443/g.69290 Transcript_38443/m.69290 type:complete len:99 (+) Transcript_38443:550-846(+)